MHRSLADVDFRNLEEIPHGSLGGHNLNVLRVILVHYHGVVLAGLGKGGVREFLVWLVEDELRGGACVWGGVLNLVVGIMICSGQ